MERKLNCGVRVLVNKQSHSSPSRRSPASIITLRIHKDDLLELAVIVDRAVRDGYVDENGMVNLFLTRNASSDDRKTAKGLLGVKRESAVARKRAVA